ncbi:MAG: oligosaccharide flippase family protein [Candidatus Woesebacteria bacterium]|nr:MAG: oligosaccharide flippase family protein [Candidatus Woesebacteria bacterium]
MRLVVNLGKAKEIISTKTFSQTLITSFGTIVNGTLGLVFYFILARRLGPAAFGIFSVSVAALTLIGDIASVGSDTGTVRFVSKYINIDRNRALQFLKLSLETRVLVWLIVSSFGWFLVPGIATAIFSKPELVFPMRLALLGVGSYLVFSFSTYALQSLQKYWIWNGVNVGTNLFRLLITLVLVYFGLLDTNNSLGTYILVPIFGFLAGLLFLPKFFTVTGEREVAGEFFRYNIWVAIFTLVAAFGGRIDTLLSTRLLSLHDVGIYSAALQLASIVPQIVFAIGTVVAPKLAGFDSDIKAKEYLKKVQGFTIFLAVLGVVVGIPLAKFMIPLLYGDNYLQAVGPFIVLLFAQAVFLISLPAHTSIFYYFDNPKLFVFVSLGNLLIVIIGGWFLISNFGFMGAAYAVLAGNIFNFIVPAAWVVNRFNSSTK